jgi:DNA invertase Pin-like site-specific DNA recombinase
VLLAEEFERAGVKLLIVSYPLEQGPEGWLFFQMGGALAEYERAKILERTHRGRNGRTQVVFGDPEAIEAYIFGRIDLFEPA